MKNRAEHARYEAYKIQTSLDTIQKLINHMDNYEIIIKRFINKRDAIRTILSNPVFNINFTDEEMLKFKYQYEILEELLKGVE